MSFSTFTGVKRVTLVKDANKGIGCTIKNAAGHVFVHRIIEDGPIAETGVLRPGMLCLCILQGNKECVRCETG